MRRFLKPIERADMDEATRRNVEQADAVLVLRDGPLTPRAAVAAQVAARLRKPVLTVKVLDRRAADAVLTWLTEQKARTLNVTGPRESRRPGIGEVAYALLRSALQTTAVESDAQRRIDS